MGEELKKEDIGEVMVDMYTLTSQRQGGQNLV